MTDHWQEHRLVVLGDTHVGDRTKRLDPALLDAIRAEQPEAILHTGDICKPSVLEALGQIAPTHAVQGNRDWFKRYYPPMAIHSEINGIRLTLAHGHINMREWALHYMRLIFQGQKTNHTYFQKQLAKLYPDRDLIIYGHLHHQTDEIMKGIRFINPGVGYPEWRSRFRSQYALLIFRADGSLDTRLKSVAPYP